MRRKFKAINVNELVDADDIDRTTKKGEMRKLYPAIHQKLTLAAEKKWSAKDMVEWLSKRGMDMSVELFRVYLRDLDREHGYDRATNKFTKEPEANMDQTKPVLGTEDAPARKAAKVSPALADQELAKPAGLTDAGWSERKAKVRAEKRKQKLNSGE